MNNYANENRHSILSEPATLFLQDLHRKFESTRRSLIAARTSPAQAIDEIIKRNQSRRSEDWTVASIPAAFENRQVEITGPAEPKMIINALKSGANVFMADFEDSLAPTWDNILGGHVALQAALRRELTFTNEAGKTYSLGEGALATLIVRPRGWHLTESGFEVDGEPMSGSLFDFGLYLFHGGAFGIETGRGPFYYLPKMESPLEARLWADVFRWSETHLELKPRSIRVTALIETLPAALAMEELLFELRDSVIGLNAGRWDYLFSMIKSISGTAYEVTFPDRGRLTMDTPFMRRYCEKIVAVCTRRRAQPMGGMSALIPSRKDAEKNERALANVKADKEREVRQGFVGTWVAHPDLVPVARAAFANGRRETNSAEPAAIDLIPRANEEPFTSYQPSYAGAMLNIDVALRYLSHWVNGLGAVAIHGLMEDAATAEISRAQLWQWRKNHVVLDNGDLVTAEWLKAAVHKCVDEILKDNKDSLSIAASDLRTAEELLLQLVLSPAETFVPFLTLPAMDRLKPQNRESTLSRAKQSEGDSHVHSRI